MADEDGRGHFKLSMQEVNDVVGHFFVGHRVGVFAEAVVASVEGDDAAAGLSVEAPGNRGPKRVD